MKGSPEQASEINQEKERIPLILYKREVEYQLSPPVTRKFYWFWTPEPPHSLEKRGAVDEIEKRLGDFCREEGKKVRASLFTGVVKETGREESLIMVEVSRAPLSEQTRRVLMENAPEPPRRYPEEEKNKGTHSLHTPGV